MRTIKPFKTIGAILLTVMLLVAGCGGSEDRAAAYFEKAQKYYDEENFEKAKIEVKNVRQIDPNNVDALYLSGLIAEKEQNFRGAFQNFNGVIQSDPENVDGLNKVAFYFASAKQYDDAVANAEKALEIAPGNAESLSILALCSVQKQDFEAAIQYARDSIAKDPKNTRAVMILAVSLSQDNIDQALRVINDGLVAQPEEERLLLLKIKALVEKKETQEVPALYKELVENNPEKLAYISQWVNFTMRDENIPEDQRAKEAEKILKAEIASKPEEDQLKIWLVQLLGKTDSTEEGMKTLEEFVASSPESETLRDSLANAYLATDDGDRAKALYAEVVDQDPTSVAAINARAKLINIAFLANDKDEAERLIAEVLAIDPENSQALILKSRIRMSEKKYTDMIPDLRVVLKNEPDSVDALMLMALANEKTGSTDLALDGYQTLLSYKSDHVGALIGSGRILLARGEIETAQKLLELALKQSPGNPEAARLLGSIYIAQQEWDSALSLSAQLIENDRTMALGYYMQGRIYLAQKNFKAGITSLEKSQEADDRIVEPLSALITAYLVTEQKDTAIKYLQKHIEKNPDHSNAKELLASVYARDNNYDQAISILTKLMDEGQPPLTSYRLLFSIYVAQQDYASAEKLLTLGISKNPDVLGLYMLQAEFYQQRGEIDKAISSYEQLLSKNPDALVAKNNLASTLLDYRLTEASLQRAAELANDLGDTEVPAFLDTAGWVQYHLENYPQALALLQLAVDKGGVGAIYQYHLGMAYFKNDMPAKAKEVLTQAVAGEDDYPGKDEAVKTLESL